MQILCAYAASQTYTETVYEYLVSFSKYSKNKWTYIDSSFLDDDSLDFNIYDVFVIHYSLRLPFGQVKPSVIEKLHRSNVLKVLFIQDEYDKTNLTKKIINQAGINLVFTVVPSRSISYVYPEIDFPFTRFVNILTGYAPEDKSFFALRFTPPSRRKCFITYRSRKLPIKYGKLGFEKVKIGRDVKDYCKKMGFNHDIDWTEKSRIYGTEWYEFILSGKAMLGSESGSNVFDWDGSLESKVNDFIKNNKKLDDQSVYESVVKPYEVDGLMNQISPRIFEMATAKTVMVLYEGQYSNALTPWRHYLPLKKDLSNIAEIFAILKDGSRIDLMVDQVYEDIILSEKYSYKQFVLNIDAEIEKSHKETHQKKTLFSDTVYAKLHGGETSLPFHNYLKESFSNLIPTKESIGHTNISNKIEVMDIPIKTNLLEVTDIPIKTNLPLRSINYIFSIYSIWPFLPLIIRKIVKQILRRY
jgi:hypothetical protein